MYIATDSEWNYGLNVRKNTHIPMRLWKTFDSGIGSIFNLMRSQLMSIETVNILLLIFHGKNLSGE